MKLKELGEKLKSILMIDDECRLYLYNDKIYCLEYIPPYEDDKISFDASFYTQCTIYLNDNEIEGIEHNFKYLTPANKFSIIQLANLVGETINDYDEYDKLTEMELQKHIKI